MKLFNFKEGNNMHKLFILFLFIIQNVHSLNAQTLDSLPLFHISDLTYEGGFRLPASQYGASSLNYSQGPIAYNKNNNSLFIVGHVYDQAIAEFSIPSLIISDSLSLLNIANDPLQNFETCLNKTTNGNPEGLDRIGGLYLSSTGEMIVNAYEYYDAPADNILTTLVIEDASQLSTSNVNGYFRFLGGAGHTNGWISPIPIEWQNALDGDLITGQSSGEPIIGRFSVGPSAFSFYEADLLTTTDSVLTTQLLDYSLTNPLRSDLSNTSLTNDMWTFLSRTTYGFIIPKTRTYFTMGYSGGHTSGVCYKCTQNDGNVCGGYCAPDTSDYYQQYWLWDLNDLLDVKSGIINAYDVEPYAKGEFVTPHQVQKRAIGGANYDQETGNLYLSILAGDTDQGPYSNPPVIEVYNTNSISAVDAFLTDYSLTIVSNPTEDIFEIRGPISNFTIEVLDSNGNIYNTYTSATNKLDIPTSTLPSGLYFIKIKHNNSDAIKIEKIIKE